MRQGDIVYRESRSFGCEAILMQRRKGAENRREVLKAYENGLTSYSWFRVEKKIILVYFPPVEKFVRRRYGKEQGKHLR